MTKNQFLKLLKDMRTEMPDATIRRENLERYFVENGYSIIGGYKQVSYFYNEMVKAVNGEESIFLGGNNIITKIDGYFALFDGFQVNLKLKNEMFESLADLFSESIYTYNVMKKQLLPNGYYYNLPTKLEYTIKERSADEVLNLLKVSIIENDYSFLKALEFKKKDEFLEELEIHYQWFNERNIEMSNWLEHTRKLIENKFDNRHILFAFKQWLKSKDSTGVEKEIHSVEPDTKNENPHPRIFTSLKSYLLFKSLEDDVEMNTKLADYSFIYRRMHKDKLIFESVKEKEFRNFLDSNSIVLDKMKGLDYCKTQRKEKNYISKKAQFVNIT